MLIFGKSVRDWREKAAYAQAKADNEYAKLHEVHCEGINDVDIAFATMAAFAADTKCRDFLYHATINLNPGERLTREQWIQAVERLEQNLKLTGHHRVVFEHIKKNRQHYHIVWSRIPPNGRSPAVNMGNDFYVHQNTAKALEKEFGLKPAPRRDPFKPSKKRQAINDRNSKIRIDPILVTQDVTQIFKESATARDFIKNLSKAGYTLTRSSKNKLVLVDKQGGYHGLLRRMEGIRTAEVTRKYPILDKMPLPSLSDVLKSRRPASKKSFRRAAFTFGRMTKSYTPQIKPSFSHFSIKPLEVILAELRKYLPKDTKKYYPPLFMRKRRKKSDENKLAKGGPTRAEIEYAESLAWAWENGRIDMLRDFGIVLPPDYFEP